MDTAQSLRSFGIFRRVVSLSLEAAREKRAIQRALRQVPTPMPWEWAAPRLVPVIAGPIIDPPGAALVRVRSDLGPMVEIGLDLGGALTFVDTSVAERRECSPTQLMERALRNLGERGARIGVERVQTGVLSGRAVRILRDRPRWASSLLLMPDELFRLFGRHDQVLAAPTVRGWNRSSSPMAGSSGPSRSTTRMGSIPFSVLGHPAVGQGRSTAFLPGRSTAFPAGAVPEDLSTADPTFVRMLQIPGSVHT